MSKKKEETRKQLTQQIIDPQPMSKVMADDFARYAKAVLSDRAIPDVRDGMKPVQRRIIYGMYREGNTYDKPTRKSATTVGYVMGNFHPHGDSSIYDALVRLSQDWKMEVPLVTMQGNNGSIDDDPPAASRYTEAKLSKISDLLVADIDENVVPMQLNFSDEILEPTVLPARFPNLLVNGAQGIAVGAVTNIPTHNLGEVIDATVYAIDHKTATVADLRKFVLGPDFPTGGIIDQPEQLNQLYETGTASFFIHCKTHIDHTKNQIVIDEIPYGTIKAQFVAQLDKFREQNHVDNISEVRDESAEEVRIVIDIKNGQEPAPILDYLRSKGMLKATFPANMLALDRGHPRTMNLLDIIRAYISHQNEVLINKCRFELDRDSRRLDVVEGLVRAVDIVDEVVSVIKKSNGKADAKKNIMEAFGFDENQAEAIVMLNLYRISSLDYHQFVDEKNSLEKHIVELKKLLADQDYRNAHIKKDLLEVKKEFATPRKTQILDHKIETEEVDITKLIAKEDVYVVLTSSGYIKRTSLKSHDASVNGDPVNDLPKLKPGDGIRLLKKCSTHDGILIFFASGTYAYIPVYQLPDLKWKEEGKHLNALLKLQPMDKVVSAFAVLDFEAKVPVVLLTEEGKIKRVELQDFTQSKITTRPLRAISLTKGDELVKAEVTTGNSDLIVVQANGFVSRYNENEVPLVKLGAAGVKAMNLGKGNLPLTDLVALDSDEHAKLVVLADKGAVRTMMSVNIDLSYRLGMKEALVKIFKSAPLNIIALRKVALRSSLPNKIVAYTDEKNVVIDLSSLETVMPGSGMKPNLGLKDDELLLGLHDEGEVIDKTLKAEQPAKTVEKAPVDNSGDKQLSLFDLFDEEDEGGEKK